MSNPEQAAAQNTTGDSSSKTEQPTFRETVNEAISKMTQDDKGIWVIPEDLPEEIVVVLETEKRRRDTQASYTKSRQDLKAAVAKADKLEEKILKNVALNLSVEQQEELEELKGSNPEAWKQKLESYETEAKSKLQEEVETDSGAAAELERRTQLLQEYNDANPDLALNDEVFENDLPQRLTGKLERGEVTFETFLTEATDYLKRGKKIAGADKVDDDDEPNLGKTGGGSTVDKLVVEEDIVTSYDKEIY